MDTNFSSPSSIMSKMWKSKNRPEQKIQNVITIATWIKDTEFHQYDNFQIQLNAECILTIKVIQRDKSLQHIKTRLTKNEVVWPFFVMGAK